MQYGKQLFLFSAIILGLFSGVDCFGQSPADSSGISGKKTSFKIGVGYNSGLNYFGRTDSLKSSGFSPSLEVDFKNGIYLSSDFIFIHNSAESMQYAATIAEAGYRFNNKANTLAGNVFGSKFFYQNGSALVQSALKAQTGVNFSYLNKIIDLNFGADAKFSDQADIGLTGGIDHIIKFVNVFGQGKGVLVFDPSAYLYSGTQNFTRTYYKNINLLFLPVSQQQVTEQGKRFDILAYEFSLPAVLRISKFLLVATPAYIVPQHVIQADGSVAQSPPGLFYVTAGVNYIF